VFERYADAPISYIEAPALHPPGVRTLPAGLHAHAIAVSCGAAARICGSVPVPRSAAARTRRRTRQNHQRAIALDDAPRPSADVRRQMRSSQLLQKPWRRPDL